MNMNHTLHTLGKLPTCDLAPPSPTRRKEKEKSRNTHSTGTVLNVTSPMHACAKEEKRKEGGLDPTRGEERRRAQRRRWAPLRHRPPPHAFPPLRSAELRVLDREAARKREREKERNVALRLSPPGPPDPHRLWRCGGASGGAELDVERRTMRDIDGTRGV
jgi:hypothetical protein